MNLEEFHSSLESDATRRLDSLQKRHRDLQRSYDDLQCSYDDLDAQNRQLMLDISALQNRCWRLTGGAMCVFCRLSTSCSHM